ncbi:unnamed protein product [Dovyalis caffra]|uniref:Uncharacterized protein n=1 Tax=Dovyalis caffra TaxID=77055 RepID=A0AAV1QSF3_9ROSI|nr:unnamed protein product [Dovyalis caffra]
METPRGWRERDLAKYKLIQSGEANFGHINMAPKVPSLAKSSYVVVYNNAN